MQYTIMYMKNLDLFALFKRFLYAQTICKTLPIPHVKYMKRIKELWVLH